MTGRTGIELLTAPTPNGWKISVALEELGLLERRDGRLRATVQGRMVLNGVIRDLLPS